MKTLIATLVLTVISSQALGASMCRQLIYENVPAEQLNSYLRTELKPFLDKVGEGASTEIVSRLETGIRDRTISQLEFHKISKRYFTALQGGTGFFPKRVATLIWRSFSRANISKNATETEAFRKEIESLVAQQGVPLKSTPWIRARMWAINHPVITSWATFTALQVATDYVTFKFTGHHNYLPLWAWIPRLGTWNFQGHTQAQVSAKIYRNVAIVLGAVGIAAVWGWLNFYPDKPIDMSFVYNSMMDAAGHLQVGSQTVLDASKNLPDDVF